ncbi:hypothetical protein HDU83_002020 [Entophlyctis luteolus]|nr:hypothetical protein HDU83_002020 [Entophlyctis luteolus]
MTLLSTTLKVALPVALGLWTFKHIGKVMTRMGKLRKDRVIDHQEPAKTSDADTPTVKTEAVAITGIKAVDGFLQIITVFFDSLVDDTAGRWIFLAIANIYVPLTAFFAFEGLRKGGLLLHLSYPVFALLSQVMGISVVTPLLWIPVYLLTTNETAASDLSLFAVSSVVVGLVLGQLPTASIVTKKKSNQRTNAIHWFQISPSLGWIPFAASPFIAHYFDLPLALPADLTAEAAFFFGLGAILTGGFGYLFAQLVNSKNGVAARVWQVRKFDACADDGVKLVCHFMFVDTVVLYAAAVYTVALKGGPQSALYTLALTPIVGPGAALSFVFGYLALA